MKTITTVLFLVLFLSSRFLHGQDGSRILAKVDDVTYAPADIISLSTIRLIDKNGNESERKAKMLQKGRHLRLTRFLEPASQKGIAFLSLPGDIMYLYLPAFSKERRIAPHVKNQSFAGTDFSYEDMEAVPYSEKFVPTFREQTENHFVLDLRPRPGLRTEYARLVMKVNPGNHCVEQIDFYNRGDIRCKQLKAKAELIDGYWYNTTLEMTDLLKDHTTIILITGISFDNDLSDDEFTVRKLKQD